MRCRKAGNSITSRKRKRKMERVSKIINVWPVNSSYSSLVVCRSVNIRRSLPREMRSSPSWIWILQRMYIHIERAQCPQSGCMGKRFRLNNFPNQTTGVRASQLQGRTGLMRHGHPRMTNPVIIARNWLSSTLVMLRAYL